MKRTLLLMWVLLLGISIQAQTTIELSGGDLQTKYEALETSPETLIIKGVLNDVDAQFLKSLGCKNILMTDATFVNDAAKAKVSFADNTTVESILLPMDMDEVTSNMFTGCTALGTAVSISSDGKTVRAHSNTAGTLKQTLSQLYLTPNTTNNNNPENNLLGSISQYNYVFS